MAQIEFELFVSYSQVAVFTAGLDKPFNDWEQDHVDQGFAWRDGSVSFATLEESGTLHCEAKVANSWKAGAETWIDLRSKMQGRFTFLPAEGVVSPAVLKADSSLRPRAQLTMTARPA